LLTELKISPPVDVVGASMGGPIAVTFALRHPEKVRTVSLFDPAYLAGAPLPWQLRTPILGEYINRMRIAPTLTAAQRRDFLHPERYPTYFIRYEQQLRYRGFLRALLSTARYYLTRDARQEFRRLGESHKPVLLLWGRADQDVPFNVSQQVMRAIPQAEFRPIDDAAHVPYYEHPEIVNPLLISFLRNN
jgi:pimeloyl-ACP methyl ester carboxylesterase